MTRPPRVFIGPTDHPRVDELSPAISDGGGLVARHGPFDAVVWTEPHDPLALRDLLDQQSDIRWVQLTRAGIESFAHLIDGRRVWTSGKGVYAQHVAEHALMLTLAGLRGMVSYSRASHWTGPRGSNLYGTNVVIIGGGAIARFLLELLRPFGCTTTVVRRRSEPIEGASQTTDSSQLDDALPLADVVVLALALTPETSKIIDMRRLRMLRPHTWVVNVARGAHIVTDDLAAALSAAWIGGAALDVTDPEPLPDSHPLWSLENCIITPHVASTPEMGRAPLIERLRENVRRFAAGEELLGIVDPYSLY